jgi:rod shape determining protein RodA
MDFDRRLLRNFDYLLFLNMAAILAVGVFSIYSATYDSEFKGYHLRQLLYIGLGLVCMVLVLSVDYKVLVEMSYIFYGVALLLLLMLVAFKYTGLFSARGSSRWIPLGPFQFQPSEFAKIVLVLALAKYINDRGRLGRLDVLMMPSAMAGLFVILTFLQPDLGTAMVYIPILLGMLHMGGAPVEYLVAFIAMGALAILLPAVAVFLGWDLSLGTLAVGELAVGAAFVALRFGRARLRFIRTNRRLSSLAEMAQLALVVIMVGLFSAYVLLNILRPYQMDRLLSFIRNTDPQGAGWQVEQSKIAIGSGRISGKGWLEGTQNRLEFLPDQHTDFVFSVIGEEWGFLGALGLVVLYFTFILQVAMVASHSRDALGALISAGVTSGLIFQVVINMGMTVGMMPVTGLPLPLVSSGGSSMISTLISLGFLLNVRLRKNTF